MSLKDRLLEALARKMAPKIAEIHSLQIAERHWRAQSAHAGAELELTKRLLARHKRLLEANEMLLELDPNDTAVRMCQLIARRKCECFPPDELPPKHFWQHGEACESCKCRDILQTLEE